MIEKDEKEIILWKCLEERMGKERVRDISFYEDVFDGIMYAMEQYAKLKVSEK
jgi:hypothetical protein